MILTIERSYVALEKIQVLGKVLENGINPNKLIRLLLLLGTKHYHKNISSFY